MARNDPQPAIDGDHGGAPRWAVAASSAPRIEKRSEVVARSIAQEIASRDLPPGYQLPSEAEMLSRYGIGRASLREGLRILEIQGLITIRPGQGGGAIVAAANSADFGRMSTLHYQGVRATFRDLVDARLSIEPMMARLAAERQDPELLAELDASTAHIDQHLDESHEYLTASKGFHTIICGASGNPVLDLFARSLQDVYSARVNGSIFPIDARDRVNTDHKAIIKAIRNGEARRAERLMREHMDELAQYSAERYPGLLDEVVDWR